MDHAAADDHGCNVDFRVDFGTFPNHESLLALDLALKEAVNTDAALEEQLPFEAGTAT